MCASANWDTELPKGLRDFLSADAFRNLSDRVSRGEAVTTVTERHVIKVRPSAQPYYLKTLANEQRFLALGLALPVGLPKVVLADFTETRGILVLEKIEGYPLAERRESGRLTERVQQDVLAFVAAMQRTALPEGWAEPYDRNEKARQHLTVLSSLSDKPADRVVRVLRRAVGRLGAGAAPVLSHGDLHPANILRSNGLFWLIDWEYAGARPSSYDPATFILYASTVSGNMAKPPSVTSRPMAVPALNPSMRPWTKRRLIRSRRGPGAV